MYSGFFENINFFHISDKTHRAMAIIAATVAAATIFFCTFALPVMAEKNSAKSTVYAVNLREDDWIYSVYVTKDKARYVSINRYDGDEIDVEIPSALEDVDVKEISREAFCNNQYITSVKISSGIEKIGKYAFSGCIGLSSVVFPTSLTEIGDGAFYGCRSLTEAELPDGTTKIGSLAFYNCRHLKTVSFPSTLRSIGDSAFQNCGMLEGLSLTSAPDLIGDMAFSGCSSLTSIDLTGVSRLGFGAFMKCTSMKKAVLGEKITALQNDTFRGCEALTKVEFSSALSFIGDSAFEGCSALKALPEIDKLEEIGSLAFMGCASLKKADIGKKTKKIGIGAFRECKSLVAVNISEANKSFCSVDGKVYTYNQKALVFCPQGYTGILKITDNTEQIAEFAATGCSHITGILMSDSLKAIGDGAFLSCPDITALSVPDSVESIGSAALGMYLYDDEVNTQEYLRLFASEGSAAEEYCSVREISFTPYPQTLVVSSERVVIAEGESFQLAYGFISEKKSHVTWESSDESVVKVKKGKLSGIAPGSAEITLSSDGFEPCVVKVIVTGIDSEKSSKEKTYDKRLIYCGEVEELGSIFSQIIDPIFSANRFWYSSAPNVAAVGDDGKVHANGRGTAVITCRMPDGSENIVTVTVTEKPSEFTVIPPENELITASTQLIGTKLYPSGSSDVITWKSDDESIMTVDEHGRITAVSQGKCTLTAVTSSGLKSSADIRCVIPIESLSLNLETRDIYQNKEFNLTASVTPEDSRQKLRWRSSDPSVATVNSKGKVTAKSFGSAVIYAETSGGLSAECLVNVITKAEELKLDIKKLKINRGSVYKLNAIIRPSYSPETTDKCTWNSTNEKVATVDENGTVTAKGAGNCIINCRTGGNLISKCQVQVRLPAESVSIKAEKNSIYIGEVISLEAVTEPKDSTDSIEWLTDGSGTAHVTSGGTVKGRSMGTALITVKLTNDVTGESVSDTIEISVLKKAEAVKLSKSSLSLLVSENDFISYAIKPDDCNDTIRWYSTDETVASVREDGLITAVSEGTCQICIETGSGVKSVCKVTVK